MIVTPFMGFLGPRLCGRLMLVVEKVRPQSLLLQQLAIMSQVLGQSRVPRVAIRKDTRQRLLWADFDSPGRGLFMVKNDQSFGATAHCMSTQR